VLGGAYVDNALKNADDFNKPCQELVTEHCWGAVWGRDELPRKTHPKFQPSCMDGPLSARDFFGASASDRGAVMYTASECGHLTAGPDGERRSNSNHCGAL
jgi:hypothetical protein